MKIIRNGVEVEIETGPAARAKAAEERKANEPSVLAARRKAIADEIRSEVVGHLLNRAASKIINGNIKGAADTLRLARSLRRNR